MHATHNSMTINSRVQSVELLNKYLAAAIDLHGQVKQAHWNVRGPAFIALHELFDRVATDVETYSDQIAERTGALGGEAEGTIQKAAEKSFLTPYPFGLAEDHQHVFAVSAALAAFGDGIRTAIGETAAWGDPATADLLTGISRGTDAQLWFVESHMAPK
jgi:starvation-inducible DNA-binding protein